MALSREHGALRPVVAPPDEQPTPQPGTAAPLVRRGDRGRVADSAAARALAKLPRRDRFVPRRIACDPRFEVHNRRRLDWQRKRREELHQLTGGVSHAVGAMIASAAWLYAAGEFAAELAASTGDVDMFKSAATLTATARTHDMGAWELAVREGEVRKRAPLDPLAAFRNPPSTAAKGPIT
jgi:hypothetical protein